MDDKTIELDEEFAVITLPPNAVEAEINVKVFQDGEIIKVYKMMDMQDLKTAFRKAEEGYIDEDARFVLTDKGREWLDSLMEDDLR